MSPRPDVSEERREQIMQAAEEIFIQKGFNNARMDDIANETGLSKGTLYLYYKSKDDVIIAILNRVFERDFQGMDDLVDMRDRTATEAIWEFVDLVTAETSAMLRLMPITYEFLALAFREPAVQKTVQQYFQRYRAILLPIIEQGIQTGEFRQVNAEEIVVAIGAIFEGTIVLWAYDNAAVNLTHHIRSSIELLLMGIQAEP